MTGAAVVALLDALVCAVGEAHVLVDEDLRAPYETDWTGRWRGRAAAVVRPGSTAEVAAVLAACGAAGVGVVPQGGNTGLVGGSVPRDGEVVLSTRRLVDLDAVDTAAGTVVAGAGVVLAELHDHAAGAGLAYGVDLAARGTATVGGTVATNAGGIRVVRHGATRTQLVGIEAVLADGRVLDRLHALPKDATGYDLPGLLCGSEGTLAVVTRGRLRLVARPARAVVALCGVDGIAAAVDLLSAVRRLPELAAAEWCTADGVALVCAHGGLPAPLRGEHGAYVLVEAVGDDDPLPALAAAVEHPAVRDVAVADDARGRAALWAYRERQTEAVHALGLPVRKLDLGLPLVQLAAFADAAVAAAAGTDVRVVLFGHLAEGNVHVELCGGADDDGLEDALVNHVAAHGGSISPEHGVGVAKRRWLHLTRSDVDLAAMRAIKHALDPAGVLNPGVLFDS